GSRRHRHRAQGQAGAGHLIARDLLWGGRAPPAGPLLVRSNPLSLLHASIALSAWNIINYHERASASFCTRERGYIKPSGAKHAFNTENNDEDPNPGIPISFASCRYCGEPRYEPPASHIPSHKRAILIASSTTQ